LRACSLSRWRGRSLRLPSESPITSPASAARCHFAATTAISIEFERKTLGKFRVIISTGSDIVVTFAILAKRASINKTSKMMETLLVANHDYDYVKIGLDKDGDLFVRIDSPMHVTHSRELKDIINQVANASEEVFVKVAGSIKR